MSATIRRAIPHSASLPPPPPTTTTPAVQTEDDRQCTLLYARMGLSIDAMPAIERAVNHLWWLPKSTSLCTRLERLGEELQQVVAELRELEERYGS